MQFSRIWAMPNGNTFTIAPIKKLIHRYVEEVKCKEGALIIDPFANSNKIAMVTNDIDPQYGTDYNLDATEFLGIFDKDSVNMVLYDPPYSSRQVSECYKKMDKTVDMQTTQSSYWSRQKKQISRIVKPGGIVISCCWNSGGIGLKMGFEIIEILLVPHGGWHNDTIVTVERKIQNTFF